MKKFFLSASGITACIAVGLAFFSVAVTESSKDAARQMTGGGDPDRGRVAIRTYGCGRCHTIPGIPGAFANVGPPLTQIGGRSYVAGVLKNTPQNLMSWIRNPPAVDDKTAMPFLGVTEADARDIASYLYTLK